MSVVAPVPRGTSGARGGRQAADWSPAAAVLVLGILLWEGLVRGLDVERFLLPAPSAILDTLWERREELRAAGIYTFSEALGGFVIGCSLAILAAIVLARFRSLGRALMPFAIAANAVPIIAFAPITNQWFGPLEKTSKMACPPQRKKLLRRITVRGCTLRCSAIQSESSWMNGPRE